jgi:hypothetical protein
MPPDSEGTTGCSGRLLSHPVTTIRSLQVADLIPQLSYTINAYRFVVKRHYRRTRELYFSRSRLRLHNQFSVTIRMWHKCEIALGTCIILRSICPAMACSLQLGKMLLRILKAGGVAALAAVAAIFLIESILVLMPMLGWVVSTRSGAGATSGIGAYIGGVSWDASPFLVFALAVSFFFPSGISGSEVRRCVLWKSRLIPLSATR